MTDDVHPTIAVMSGKGGVGKTTLSANLARVLSTAAPTALVDLDLENRGLTGLFSAYAKLEASDAAAGLLEPNTVRPTRVEETLWVLPSQVRSGQPEDLPEAGDLTEAVRKLVDAVREATGAVFVVLDCHGGLTDISLAAFEVATDLLIITEADPVTFGGTIALVDALSERATEVGTRHARRSHFLINRIPPKFKARELNRLYETVIARDFAIADVEPAALHLIPTEPRLFETFGEYPYQVDLEPRSLFTDKIRVLASCFCRPGSGVEPTDLKGWGRLSSKRRREKVINKVRSTAVEATAIGLRAFAVSLVVGLVVLPINAIVWEKTPAGSFAEQSVEVISALIGIPAVLYLLYACVKLLMHFWSGAAFHYRLGRVLPSSERPAHIAFTVRHAVLALFVGAALVAPLWWAAAGSISSDWSVAPAEALVATDSWNRQARTGALSARARLENTGFRLLEPVEIERIRPGQGPAAIQFTWQPGLRYWVVFGCDKDCSNLEVQTGQRLEVLDQRPGDTPEILVQPLEAGEYPILVDGECSAPFCAVAAARYAPQTNREQPSGRSP